MRLPPAFRVGAHGARRTIFQILIFLSDPAVAKRLPSAWMSTENMGWKRGRPFLSICPSARPCSTHEGLSMRTMPGKPPGRQAGDSVKDYAAFGCAASDRSRSVVRTELYSS